MLLVQALLSSSIMFSNFMSIYQRRAETKEKAEQSNRCCSAFLHSRYTPLPTLVLNSKKGGGGWSFFGQRKVLSIPTRAALPTYMLLLPCHAMPCHAMLCYAMLCYAMLCSIEYTLMCVL